MILYQDGAAASGSMLEHPGGGVRGGGTVPGVMAVRELADNPQRSPEIYWCTQLNGGGCHEYTMQSGFVVYTPSIPAVHLTGQV